MVPASLREPQSGLSEEWVDQRGSSEAKADRGHRDVGVANLSQTV